MLDQALPIRLDGPEIVDQLCQIGRQHPSYAGACRNVTSGAPTEALPFFEEAYTRAPTHPIIANNLAWLLTHTAEPQLEHGLVELALKAPLPMLNLKPGE